MAGRLVEQVSRLIKAGIAGVTEESPDPAIGIERSLHLVRDRLGAAIVERRRLAKKLADLPANVSELSGKAEVAVRKGREDLARAALSHVNDMEQDKALLEIEMTGLDADIALLERAVAHLTGEKRAAASQPDDATIRALLAELERLEKTGPGGEET